MRRQILQKIWKEEGVEIFMLAHLDKFNLARL